MPDLRVLLQDKPGNRVLLLGNEAIARGVLEAGVGVVTTYPGTPASEIGDSISAIATEAGLYMEYSTNEIVAAEVAAGAANSGVRALTAMKHVGLNVASDLLMTQNATVRKMSKTIASTLCFQVCPVSNLPTLKKLKR